jgi:hypothetical protein
MAIGASVTVGRKAIAHDRFDDVIKAAREPVNSGLTRARRGLQPEGYDQQVRKAASVASSCLTHATCRRSRLMSASNAPVGSSFSNSIARAFGFSNIS